MCLGASVAILTRRCRPVVVLSTSRCFPTENALYPISLHIVAGLFSPRRGGYTPPTLYQPNFAQVAPCHSASVAIPSCSNARTSLN